jgi:A/G-specific adenine glycosylase
MLRWYRRNARELPWRGSRNPYQIWVSEVMLQQTQVETIKNFYPRFLKKFPTIERLAEAKERDVLLLWEGLGYYRRARQLHAAARLVVERHDGRLPRDVNALLTLPGIGRYTAGAILSIAFDDRHPVLEGNTIRVYSRLIGYTKNPRDPEGQRLLWAFAQHILPRRHVGMLNQSMMELGSLICSPKSPNCSICPVQVLCGASRRGLQDQIPAAAKPTQYEQVCEIAVVIRHRDAFLLRQCAASERWAGLWDFPRFRADTKDIGAITRRVQQMTGIKIRLVRKLTSLKHGVTRFRIDLDCYEADCKSSETATRNGYLWINRSKLSRIPLSVTGRKISNLLGKTATD